MAIYGHLKKKVPRHITKKFFSNNGTILIDKPFFVTGLTLHGRDLGVEGGWPRPILLRVRYSVLRIRSEFMGTRIPDGVLRN